MSNCAQKYCAVHVLPLKCLLTCWKVAWTRFAGNMLLRKIILRSVNVVQWIANVNMMQKKRHTYFPKYLSFIVTNTNTMQTCHELENDWLRVTDLKETYFAHFQVQNFFFNLHQLSHAVHSSLPPSKTLSFRSCLCNFFCSLKNSKILYFCFYCVFSHHINLHLLPLASIQYI